MNKKLRILWGIYYVLSTPIVTPVLWLVNYTKDNFANGCLAYNWKHNLNAFSKE